MNCWSFSVQNAKHKSNLLLFLHRINFYRRDRVGTSVKNPPVMWLWSFTKTLPITWQRWETHLTHTVIIIIIINTTPAKWYCNMCNPIVTHEIITLAIKFMVVLRVLGTRNTIYKLYYIIFFIAIFICIYHWPCVRSRWLVTSAKFCIYVFKDGGEGPFYYMALKKNTAKMIFVLFEHWKGIQLHAKVMAHFGLLVFWFHPDREITENLFNVTENILW